MLILTLLLVNLTLTLTYHNEEYSSKDSYGKKNLGYDKPKDKDCDKCEDKPFTYTNKAGKC